jgi:23S rRNA maturation mini-RNase III
MKSLLGLFKRGEKVADASQQAPKQSSKKKWLIGGGIGALLGGLYLLGRRDDTEPTIDTQQPQQPQLQKHDVKPKTSKAGQMSVGSSSASQETPQDSSVVGAFIPELIKLYQLSNALAMQYEQDANTFYQIYQTYEKKLEELMPIITMELAKTPLSQMTDADLPAKISTLFKYYSWDFAVNNFPKILQGYYLVKMHNKNQDTSNLTINDLIAVANNPALAQNENVVKLFETIGELYKLKMQNALGQIGKLKDIYSYKLQTLKEQANMIKDMVNAILDQEELNFKRWAEREKINISKQRLAVDKAYKMGRLAQGWEALRLKREQMNQSALGGGSLINTNEDEE